MCRVKQKTLPEEVTFNFQLSTFNFQAAVLQPIGENCVSDLLEQAAGSFMLLFAIVALTGIFFFFMILIVLAAGGAALS